MALLEGGGREFEANTHPRAMPANGMDSSGWPALPSVVGQSLSAVHQLIYLHLLALRHISRL